MKQSITIQESVIDGLKREILALQGYKRVHEGKEVETGLGPLERAFPNRQFPTGVVHEFISYQPTDASATNGFMGAVLGRLTQKGGTCLWIGARRTLFPAAMKFFGIQPDQIIFIDGVKPKEALWTIEEGLKCNSLCAVIGEVPELSFIESRRLQLAVENSKVTGFIHRNNPRSENTVACMTRWKIRSIIDDRRAKLPGVGFPNWQVDLVKVRNGHPGSWHIEWSADNFNFIEHQPEIAVQQYQTLQTG